jgi:hypothetical protein
MTVRAENIRQNITILPDAENGKNTCHYTFVHIKNIIITITPPPPPPIIII